MIRKRLLMTCAAGLLAAGPLWGQTPAEAMKQAITAIDSENWTEAEAEGRIAGPLAFDIVEWSMLRAGEGGFANYEDFSRRRADWPGIALLHKQGEDKLDGVDPARVIAYFSHIRPKTGTGAIALIAAYQARGQHKEAADAAEYAWRNLALTKDEQDTIVARYGDLVAPHHGGRMQEMLDRGDLTQARRMLDLVAPGTRAVARARIALQSRETDGVDALVAAVPDSMMHSFGLARDRAVWRWRQSLEDGAADLLLEWSADRSKLGKPELWSDVRARMARWDLRAGNTKRAYKIAVTHHLKPSDTDYPELEFLAGFAALRLGDGKTALHHFQAEKAAVTTPISVSRAAYWCGRAREQMGDQSGAHTAYEIAARYQTSFYGLLASDRLGLRLKPEITDPPALPDWRSGSFVKNSVFQAALLLNEAGDRDLAERFLLHLDERLPADQTARLIDLALEWHDSHIALRLAKRAALSGHIIMQGYFPVPKMSLDGLVVPQELALSIARRESEFDVDVHSYAGALGLMQLMPGTAKMMADELGEPYDKARLTSDPSYNARLGSEYLKHLRDEFGNSPLLVAAGYNAGAGRPRRWIEEQGDPRRPTVDLAEWVELIPFDETRTYVMRVAAGLPIYRARLGLKPVPFSDELRGLK